DAEQRVALETQLEDVRRGVGRAPRPDERMVIASKVLRPKKLFAEAVKFYAEAFQAAGLPSETAQDCVLEAASSAVLAGSAEGGDAAAGSSERRGLRDQARIWLSSALAASEEELAEGGAQADRAVERVRAWTKDRGLGRVRPPLDPGLLASDESEA